MHPLGTTPFTGETLQIAGGIPAENITALAIFYQEGEEADYADWFNAFDDDAVRPRRVVEGESNFPEMDANSRGPRWSSQI